MASSLESCTQQHTQNRMFSMKQITNGILYFSAYTLVYHNHDSNDNYRGLSLLSTSLYLPCILVSVCVSVDATLFPTRKDQTNRMCE